MVVVVQARMEVQRGNAGLVKRPVIAVVLVFPIEIKPNPLFQLRTA